MKNLIIVLFLILSGCLYTAPEKKTVELTLPVEVPIEITSNNKYPIKTIVMDTLRFNIKHTEDSVYIDSIYFVRR